MVKKKPIRCYVRDDLKQQPENLSERFSSLTTMETLCVASGAGKQSILALLSILARQRGQISLQSNQAGQRQGGTLHLTMGMIALRLRDLAAQYY
jgi:hypothetical protein